MHSGVYMFDCLLPGVGAKISKFVIFFVKIKKMSKIGQKSFLGIGIDLGIGIMRLSQLGIEEIEGKKCFLYTPFMCNKSGLVLGRFV